MNTSFADLILNISVTGQLIRLELGTLVSKTDTEGNHQFETISTQQIVMPLEGFVRGFSTQEAIIKKLIENGVLTVNEESTSQSEPLVS